MEQAVLSRIGGGGGGCGGIVVVSQPSSARSKTAPVAGSKIFRVLLLPGVGLMFGSSHGFTQIGSTIGEVVALVPPTFDGLYASAVAVALMEIWRFPHIRAKNVGRSVLCT